eukprot:TRINITY_DN6812_c0_g1_i15.p1 TRINITY_DN6812_c0_g1~~TRINITY_DN6812_c0_g1_i15.p1  ORF type:complete len:303 (-),score=50.24 TRINITY_DN6812_c0_g1_i15:594-1502(-)
MLSLGRDLRLSRRNLPERRTIFSNTTELGLYLPCKSQKLAELRKEIKYPIKIIGTRKPGERWFWAWDANFGFFFGNSNPFLYLTFQDKEGKIFGPIRYHTEMKTWGPKIELSFRMQYGRLSTYDQVDLYSLPEKIRVMKGFEVALGGLIFPVYSRILFSVEEHSFPVKDEQLNLPSETQPGVHLGTQAGTQSGIQSELQPRLQLGSQPGTQPGPQPGLQTGTQPGPQPGVQPESRPGTQAGLQPGLQPEAQPQPPQKKKKKAVPPQILLQWVGFGFPIGVGYKKIRSGYAEAEEETTNSGCM